MNKLFIISLAALSLVAQASQAQEYRTKISGKDQKIVIDMQGSDVMVEGTDGN